jgi:hypothetical protein
MTPWGGLGEFWVRDLAESGFIDFRKAGLLNYVKRSFGGKGNDREHTLHN